MHSAFCVFWRQNMIIICYVHDLITFAKIDTTIDNCKQRLVKYISIIDI